MSIENGAIGINLQLTSCVWVFGWLAFNDEIEENTCNVTKKEIQMQEDFTKEFKDIENRIGLLRRLL